MALSKDIVIYADDRDDSRISNILEKKCALHKKRLDLGDIILSKNVIAERKTTEDFVASIVGRVLETISSIRGVVIAVIIILLLAILMRIKLGNMQL